MSWVAYYFCLFFPFIISGSAWMALSRPFVDYCIWGWDNLPRTILMYYANFLSSPEGYFHTVVCNSEEFRNTTVNHDLHFISWDNPPKQHPHHLTVSDFSRYVPVKLVTGVSLLLLCTVPSILMKITLNFNNLWVTDRINVLLWNPGDRSFITYLFICFVLFFFYSGWSVAMHHLPANSEAMTQFWIKLTQISCFVAPEWSCQVAGVLVKKWLRMSLTVRPLIHA